MLLFLCVVAAVVPLPAHQASFASHLTGAGSVHDSGASGLALRKIIVSISRRGGSCCRIMSLLSLNSHGAQSIIHIFYCTLHVNLFIFGFDKYLVMFSYHCFFVFSKDWFLCF